MTSSGRVGISCFTIIFGQAVASAAISQIATDGTVGPRIELSGTDVIISDDLGRRAGNNLFHSFGQFNIETGQSVTFTGPGDLDNVISRVTGGDPSDINGQLRSLVGTADFWLINPNGVTFGPGASLDVPGSFHVSTADEIVFSDGASYSATLPNESDLTVAAPESFGFFDRDPAGINVRNAAIGVGDGETISLVGGDISIEADFGEGGSFIGSNPAVTAQNGGLINLISVASSGEVNIATGEVSARKLGDIQIGQRSTVSFSGAGEIRVRGNVLTILTDVFGSSANDSSIGLSLVDIDVNDLVVDGGEIRTISLNAANEAAEIRIKAEDVRVINGGRILSTSNAGSSDGGEVTIVARRVLVSGDGSRISTDADGTPGVPFLIPPPPPPPPPAVSSDVPAVPPVAAPVTPPPPPPPPVNNIFTGGAGTVTINADSIVVTDNGTITSSSTSGGDGGEVRLSGLHLLVTDRGKISADASFDGEAGLIAIDVDGTVIVEDGGTLSTTAQNSGGGLIDIQADDYVLFRDTEVSTTISDTGGDIQVETGILILDDSRVDLDAQGDLPTFSSITGEFLKSAESEIEVNSTLIEPETTDLGDELALLEADLADPSDLMRESCEAGGDYGGSTFVASGAGVPIAHDGLLPGFYGFPGDLAKEADRESKAALDLSLPCPN